MPVCFLCGHNIDLNEYQKHLRNDHSRDAGYPVPCAEEGCYRQPSTFKTFKIHFKAEHVENIYPPQNLPPDDPVAGRVDSDNDEPMAPPFDDPPDDSQNEDSDDNDDVDFSDALTKLCALFCSRISGHRSIPRNACQLIIEYAAELHDTITRLLMKKVDRHLKKEGGPTPEDIQEIDVCLAAVRNSFYKLCTEHLRIKYFTQEGLYIPPESFLVGERSILRTINGEPKWVNSDVYGQFIPLRKTLKLFFEYQNVFTETVDYMSSFKEDTGALANFVQGTAWRNNAEVQNAAPGTVVFPLTVFVDDYGTGNPLSVNSSVNKLCAVYTVVSCLPPKIQSLLNSILLTVLVRSKDREEFGNARCFNVLIDEINFLRSTGISVSVNGAVKNVRFLFGVRTGDNLGLNQTLGFVGSFSANHPCRFCRVHKDDLHKLCREDGTLLRTEKNYDEDLATNNLSETGVKEMCVWNRITGFHATSHAAADLMHDILEGCAGLDLVFILNYCIDEGFFSRDVLCLKVTDFNYGCHSKNKPRHFEKSFSEDSIKLTASEMLTLVTYLPLIIGDQIPVGNFVWELFLSLRELLDLVMSPVLPKDASVTLGNIAEEHNDMYLKLTNAHLTPKLHNLIHYASLFLKFGPLKHLWCMRFEGYHQNAKISAASLNCRRNVPKSIAIRNQYKLCNQLNSSTLFPDTLDHGPAWKVTYASLTHFSVQEKLLNLNFPDPITSTSWVKLGNTVYKPKMILLCDVDEDLPSFAQIEKIIFLQNSIHYICLQFLTISYERHFCAFLVENTHVHTVVCHNDLQHTLPLSLSKISNGNQFVTVNYKI